jgi:hypothetical protein
MQGIRIGVRINGHRADPKLSQGPNNPAGNGAAIGNEYFTEHDLLSTISLMSQ